MRLPGGGGYCSDTKNHNGYYSQPTFLSRPVTPSKPNLNSLNNKTPNNIAENHGSNLPSPAVIICKERFDFFWHHGNKVGCGLRNMGNTCFLSSILQCLTHVPAWCNYLVSEHHQKSCKDAVTSSKNCIMCILSRHVCISMEMYHPIFPEEIVNNLKQIGEHMVRGQQEDAHDFLLSLFNSLQKILCPQNLDIYSENTTALSRIFSGFLRSQVICSKCKKPSNTYEPFFNISLEIKGHNNIMSCLRKYTSSENMDDDNMFSCDNCQSRQTAEKRYTIHRAPNTLILQLKRYNQDSYTRVKLTHHVHFPDILDIESFLSSPTGRQENGSVFKNSGVNNNGQINKGQTCTSNAQSNLNKMTFNSNGTTHNSNMQFFSGSNNKIGFNSAVNYRHCAQTQSNYAHTLTSGTQNNALVSNNCIQNSGNLYKLHGVVVHSGMNIGSGHYLAYVFNSISKQWFCMDDDKVEKVSWQQVRMAQAYLLFYIATKPLQKLPQIPQVPIFNRNINPINKSTLIPPTIVNVSSCNVNTNIDISISKTVTLSSKNLILNDTVTTNAVNNYNNNSSVLLEGNSNINLTSPVKTSLPIIQPRIIRPLSNGVYRPILPVNGKPFLSIPAIKIHARLKPTSVKQPPIVDNLVDIPLPPNNKDIFNTKINCAKKKKVPTATLR